VNEDDLFPRAAREALQDSWCREVIDHCEQVVGVPISLNVRYMDFNLCFVWECKLGDDEYAEAISCDGGLSNLRTLMRHLGEVAPALAKKFREGT
jgi:hypothetical protein